VLDENLMKARITELGCVSLSSDETSQVQLSSGTNIYHRNSYDHSDTRMDSNYLGDIRIVKGEDSSSLASDQSQASTPMFRSRRRKRFWRRGFSGDVVGTTFSGDDTPNVGNMSCAYSDSECSPKTWRHRLSNSGPSKFEVLTQCREALKENKKPSLRHVSSLTYGRESHKKREDYISNMNKVVRKSMDETSTTRPSELRQNSEARLSIYDNVPLVICNKSYFDYHSESTAAGKGAVERWHSFNRKSSSVSAFQRSGNQIYGLSVGQMNHVRKRALLRLTALMERHCPSHRSSWNWELPKFIKKIKSPDYKDKAVFGIPLQVINQRTGYPLPVGIQRALTHLKNHCIDQVGLFRKPGVRSRIQNLRDLHETESDICYFDFGAFDIADMVKTYFRELPEVLLTNKLSEIFIIICQYLPVSVRLEALQCVMLMMPDENREVLMYLLYFLSHMAANSHLNQMTESNLAVCMAPSLFFLNMGSSSSSPLRKKTLGTPEQKDLHDNKAAHQCLTLMIQEVNQLQCLPVEMLSNCRFSFLDLSQPVSLEDLGSASNVSYACNEGESYWIAYMRACIDSLLRESKDKARGWMHINYPDPVVEVCYRKVGDGHPLRLWKVTTDVEAPPTELLNRVLRERHLWDDTLLKWRVVKRLNKEAEVFQYMCNSMPPRPPLDYCVLRCWKTDFGKGLCVIVETSVEHTDAPPLPDSTRGIVLASRYLIQPCGSGKSRITNISRIDMR
ncbi:Alpha-L-fucosidase, partial [Armadillidium nasatum]